ncbi:MAG: VanZ family protein [Gallionella sp.]|nr:VanZ family protein [Gallionella sp.]
MYNSRIFRLACLAGAVFLITSLFWIGAKPIAVGLFPGPLDKVAHFATFGLIAALLWLSLIRAHPMLVVTIASIFGAADEFHQRFLSGRSASMEDLATDILAVVLIVSLLEYTRRRNEWYH